MPKSLDKEYGVDLHRAYYGSIGNLTIDDEDAPNLLALLGRWAFASAQTSHHTGHCAHPSLSNPIHDMITSVRLKVPVGG